jgi:2,3-bisphosphoglycerate-dependent phosphoglycerate mutase
MTTLIVARHGNTFEKNEPPRRVGARTDLQLTQTGRMQARGIGLWLKEQRLIPDVVYSSTLKRTIETAELAIRGAGLPQPVFRLEIFNEIDYGPDEDKPETDVIARLGQDALAAWDHEGIVPEGWQADPNAIIRNWQGFGQRIREHDDNEVVLAVTSNGIARFAPHMTGDFKEFASRHTPKLATGALGVFRYANGHWQIDDWNVRPAMPALH